MRVILSVLPICRDIRECLKLDQEHSQCHAHYKVCHPTQHTHVHTDTHTHVYMWMSTQLKRAGITVLNHTFPHIAQCMSSNFLSCIGVWWCCVTNLSVCLYVRTYVHTA